MCGRIYGKTNGTVKAKACEKMKFFSCVFLAVFNYLQGMVSVI